MCSLIFFCGGGGRSKNFKVAKTTVKSFAKFAKITQPRYSLLIGVELVVGQDRLGFGEDFDFGPPDGQPTGSHLF